MIQFSSTPHLEFPLDLYLTKQEVKERIRRIVFRSAYFTAFLFFWAMNDPWSGFWGADFSPLLCIHQPDAPRQAVDERCLWSIIHGLLKTCNLSESWWGRKFSVSCYNVVNKGEFSVTILASFSDHLCHRWVRSFQGKASVVFPRGWAEQDSVHLHFLVVTISFVLWGSNEFWYLYLSVCWIEEDQVFRRKPLFFLSVKTWMSSHNLRKRRQKPKETLSLEPLNIQAFHLQEIYLDPQRIWQLPQYNTCFDERRGICMACGYLLVR